MISATTITPIDDAEEVLAARKRDVAIEKLDICRTGISRIDTSSRDSWQRIMAELADGGFTDAELETELAAGRNTLYKWKTGVAAPREMTRRLLQKAVLEMVDQRIKAFRN